MKMHRTQRNTDLSTVAVAALIGGLAGAIVGLMFAPKSGKALRRGIYEKADDVLARAGDVTFDHARTLKHQGIDLVDKGKRLAEDLQTFIEDSLKIKKVDNPPIDNANSTQNEEPAQPQAETETTPLILVQPEIPPQEE